MHGSCNGLSKIPLITVVISGGVGKNSAGHWRLTNPSLVNYLTGEIQINLWNFPLGKRCISAVQTLVLLHYKNKSSYTHRCKCKSARGVLIYVSENINFTTRVLTDQSSHELALPKCPGHYGFDFHELLFHGFVEAWSPYLPLKCPVKQLQTKEACRVTWRVHHQSTIVHSARAETSHLPHLLYTVLVFNSFVTLLFGGAARQRAVSALNSSKIWLCLSRMCEMS